MQAAKCEQPSVRAVVIHMLKVHYIIQPLGLPLFYTLMKWGGVRFTAPGPSWYRHWVHLLCLTHCIENLQANPATILFQQIVEGFHN